MHLNAAISEELSTPLAKLRAKAAEFNTAYTSLMNRKPDPVKEPTLYKKWLTLKGQGDTARVSIGRILGAADWVGNVASSVWEYVSSPLGGGLGVLPLVPLAITGAVIASAMTGMTYFITSAYEYGKLAEASPDVRSSLLKKDSSGVANIMSSATGLLLVAGAIYFLPKVLKGIK